MRKATSRDGEYFAFSIATTVCRVTPISSANCCCVISPQAARNARIQLRMLHLLTSNTPAVIEELQTKTDYFRQDQGENNQISGQNSRL